MKKLTFWITSYLKLRWYERFVSLFVAAILMSSLSIFENYWWPESFKIAYFTLGFTALVDILLPLKGRLIRLLLQFIAVVFITFRFARMEWSVAPSTNTGEWGWWLQETLAGLHPFLWIGLSLLVIHSLFTTWTVTRQRMFGFTGASILVLTVADSFTPIWLWDNVAVVVFIALAWLVLNHLDRLQRTHPESLKELMEYPIRVFTPAVIVLSVLLVIALNVPSIAPMLQDPYTIWKKARGEDVQVFLGEKALTREDYAAQAGNSSSGYSRNDDVLGGGFDYDFSPMMTVSTSQRSYWRGETLGQYTGQGWKNAIMVDGERVLPELPFFDESGRERAQFAEVRQVVTMERDDAYPVLFGAAPISTVHWINDESSAVMANAMKWSPYHWELRWNTSLTYPKSYSITSSVVTLDEGGLRTAESILPSNDLNEYYLSLPASLPDRVRELAQEVTADGKNDYDRAKAIETHLRQNYIYNNKPDLSKLSGSSADFVDGFLFELQEGYCDYFSTAMAVMARSIGLPSRWVKGFTPGVLPVERYGPPGEMMDGERYNPTGAGMYTVRNSDAHSWVEIYFEGFGWIPFEPTSGFRFPYLSPAGEEMEPVLPDEKVSETPEVASNISSGLSRVWGLASLIVLVVAAAAWLIVKRREMAKAWFRIRHGSLSPNEQIVMEANRLIRFCKKRGMKREEHETLREAIAGWSQSQKRLQEDFRTVLDGFEKAKYGASGATKEEVERYTNKVRYLIGELK
ncbi:transglutaminase TgpA family protein [Paenibacillus paeoniae]|nr:transglutaminase domain-containing protein [Paenibacillus paeoniae]